MPRNSRGKTRNDEGMQTDLFLIPCYSVQIPRYSAFSFFLPLWSSCSSFVSLLSIGFCRKVALPLDESHTISEDGGDMFPGNTLCRVTHPKR